MSFRIGLIAFVLLVGASGCSRSNVAPEDETKGRVPMAALFQYSVWDAREAPRTPKLVIYDDGLMVLRRDYPRQPKLPDYWEARLDEIAMSELAMRQTQVLRDPGYASFYRLSRATDLPSTVLYFGTGKQGTATLAYGLWIDDTGASASTGGPDFLPRSLLEYHVFLAEILHGSREWKPWHPDSYIAWLQATESGPPLTWPRAWPGWRTARISADGNSAEIVVPVTTDDEFWSALAPAKGDSVRFNGRMWTVRDYPHFPGSDVWGQVIERDIDSGYREE